MIYMTITSLDRILLLKLLCCISIFLLFSCSREKPADIKTQEIPETRSEKLSEELKTKTLYNIEIKPTDATRNSTINVIPHGFKLDDAKIEWLLNGRLNTGSASSTFNANQAIKGDRIQARVIIDSLELFSNVIYIKNARPEISRVKILPEVIKPGTGLSVEAEATDPDGDEATILYEWTKNGEPAGNSSQIEGLIKRGDKVSIKITPFDGEDYGQPITLKREIKNMPPIIIDDKKFNFDGKLFTYYVKASDPDGDVLTYQLTNAPEGMSINAETGEIRWLVPDDFTGRVPITVSVTDGHGGDVTQQLTFIINPAKGEGRIN